jgi:mono/diheme cytochrome c family protein
MLAEGIAPEDADRIALERAIDRGRHLVEARYACGECHGGNFGGGVMVDVFPIGTLLGPNITTGAGSKTLAYAPSDWDRIVRHGVLPDGRPSAMPSVDFARMSDQELSDVVAYIRSNPPVDNQVPAPTLGPLGKVLVATGQIILSATEIESHTATHLVLPPEAAPTVEFGRHIAGVCTGCHAQNLAGGPIAGGDPAWPPAANLTPHATGMAGWTLDDFSQLMTEGTKRDGTAVLPPMNGIVPFGRNMTDVEMEALFLYLQSIPAVASLE